MDTTIHSPPEPENTASAAAHETGTPTPYQPPTREQLHQDWPLAPEARGRIVAGLVAMTQPGATSTRKTRDGRTLTKEVSPRHTVRAARLLKQIGSIALDQQRQDHQAKCTTAPSTLNDFVSPVFPLAHDRMTAEAERQGLDTIFELEDETINGLYQQAEQDYIAEHGPIPKTGPTPLRPTAPEQRNDWVIPKETQRQVMARLCDMADPQGQAYPFLRVRERLMATEVLLQFCRLVAAQERLGPPGRDGRKTVRLGRRDRRVEGSGPPVARAATPGRPRVAGAGDAGAELSFAPRASGGPSGSWIEFSRDSTRES